jgi:hypothetical protein
MVDGESHACLVCGAHDVHAARGDASPDDHDGLQPVKGGQPGRRRLRSEQDQCLTAEVE